MAGSIVKGELTSRVLSHSHLLNFHRDQLWTNDGLYKPAEPGQEFPEDLADYPDPSVGWMNEVGMIIDLQHRMIPKTPARSALKRPDTQRRATV
jgi:hypothetical protein